MADDYDLFQGLPWRDSDGFTELAEMLDRMFQRLRTLCSPIWGAARHALPV